jgi:methionyl-tRNA formyltransferase
MKMSGSTLLLETLDLIDSGNIQPIAQESIAESFKPAPKLSRETARIDWSNTSEQVNNKIRGLSPYPGAWTTLTGKDGSENSFKILSATPSNEKELEGECGSIETDVKSFIHVKCGKGYLNINKLQLSGRGAMLIDEFLRGYGFLLVDNKFE